MGNLSFRHKTQKKKHQKRNYTYTVTLLSALADLDAALKATPTTRYYDFATPATRPAWDR